MSEYQFVGFRAIDCPVTGENLEYMKRQSTRATITPWSFENEYHYGDFHGNALEMMRRGYNIHLHYSNYGILTLMIRLPYGLPDPASANAYLDGERFDFKQDKDGEAGTLILRPYYEPGDLEGLWGLASYLDRLIPLRAEILGGDLRPLYLAHLIVCVDSDHDLETALDAPVPAGLKELTDAQVALCDLHGIREDLLVAAGAESEACPARNDLLATYSTWLSQQSDQAKLAWLTDIMLDSASSVRSTMLAAFAKEQRRNTWPVTHSERTIADLFATAEAIANRRAAAKVAEAERARRKELAKLAKDPDAIFRRCQELVARRSLANYRIATQLLVDLREALAKTDRADLPEEYARKLKQENPRLYRLLSTLRDQGFVPK